MHVCICMDVCVSYHIKSFHVISKHHKPLCYGQLFLKSQTRICMCTCMHSYIQAYIIIRYVSLKSNQAVFFFCITEPVPVIVVFLYVRLSYHIVSVHIISKHHTPLFLSEIKPLFGLYHRACASNSSKSICVCIISYRIFSRYIQAPQAAMSC